MKTIELAIEEDRDIFGGRFTSDGLLNSPDGSGIGDQWFDFRFPGDNRDGFWEATIETASLNFWDQVILLAIERAESQLSPAELEKERSYISVPVPDNPDWVTRVKEFPDIQYPQFGGLTFSEYKDQLKQEILINEPPQIFESFSIADEFLYITVDAPAISYALIDQVIDRFFALGQTEWQSDTPVPRDRLPLESKSQKAMFMGQAMRKDWGLG